ncbi:MAG: hypothetical protein EAZ55_11850 [Cytophagales bacterium]|nr:MAG: hypothetical protein EAZ55_11850 [Cytophagales bacterium]
MKKSFKFRQQIIAKIYQENDLPQEDIFANAKAEEEYFELKNIKKQLDRYLKTPSEKVIQNILNYSKNYNQALKAR